MRLLTLFVVLLVVPAVAPVAVAQAFPAPGTGVFTWERVGDRMTKSASMSFTPSGRLYVTRDSTFEFEPSPSGPPSGFWRTVNQPPPFLDAILAFDSTGDTIIVSDRSSTYRTLDGGTTWTTVHGGNFGVPGGAPEPDGLHLIPAGHPHAGRILSGGTILYSDDRGATFTEATRSFPSDQGIAHVFTTFASGQVLMAGNWGVARSEDSGTSYVVTPVWGDYRFRGEGLATVATPGSVQSGSPACGLADLSLCDGAILVGTDALGPGARAWWTNDGGRSWSEPVDLPQEIDGAASAYSVGVVALPPGPDGLGRAVTVLGRGLVYVTSDGGQTWQVVGRLPLDISPNGPSHFPQLVRLGPDGHLWVSTTKNGPTRAWMYRSAEPAEAAFPVAGEALPEASSEIGVSVRPNPAGGRVEVVVTLAEAQAVRVVVLDALGREVAVVLAGEASAGARSVVVDVSLWAAGVYVVRAEAGARVATARLLVAR